MRRRVAALWRTSGALALALLAATACGHTAASPGPGSTESRDPRARPVLTPVGQSPLLVEGQHFRPHERVRLTARDLHARTVDARADANGSFRATFHGMNGCGSITVTATGSKGSRAQFNLSQIVCR